MLSHEELSELPGKEMPWKRTINSKIYDLGGSHYQAVLYPEPVHIRNARGEWEEIEHTLTRKGNILVNESPDLSVQFAPGGSVVLARGRYTLSWSLPAAKPVEPEEEKRPADKSQRFPRHPEGHVLESTVQYAELFPGVDMTARIMPCRFKDTLIFKNSQALRPVEFHLHAPDLRPVQQENGDVLFMNEDRMVFRLPAPFIADGQGNPVPGSAHVDLKELDRECWAWTVEPDSSFAAKAAFPIRLDPVVETERTTDAASMAYVTSVNPSVGYPATGYSTNIAHNHYGWGECYTFLRFEDASLPQIDSSYYVTAATLTMISTAANGGKHVYLREVLDDWSAAAITYTQATNGEVNVGDKYLEYANANSEGTAVSFNIANQVRQWYAGTNHGLRLEIINSGLVQLGAMGAVYSKPYVTIDYISLAGLEGYLAQESHNCGRAGTAYVNLFNGNLVVAHQDTDMNGSLMPFSVTRYYNSCYRDVNPFGAGYGWKYSSQQTLHRETIGSVLHYVYMDGDGTRHHFRQTAGTWNDLSGLFLKLTVSGSDVTITDKDDNTMTFDLPTAEFNNDYSNVKMIRTMADALGNTITFTHDSSRLTTAITDGANRTTTMSATGITAPGMNTVTSVLTGSMLTGITHEDSASVQYAYDSGTGLLNKMTNHDNSSLEFTYTGQEPYRVTLVTYKDRNGAVCGGRKYEYGDCRTAVTDMIPNGSTLTAGKTLIYHFNDAGNVVSVNDGLGYGCFAGYSSSIPLNHPQYISRMQRAVNNYLKNHHFLTVNSDWTSALLDGASGTGAYNSDQVYAGGRAYKLKKTSAAGQVTVYQNVTLTKGRTYTFSCWYRTADAAEAQLRVEYKNSSGTTVSTDSATAVSTDRWDRIFLPFTIPSDSTSATVTVRMMATGGIGSVWVDAAQVEDGPVANRYNLLQNGAFTMNSSGVPSRWTAGSENVTADDCLVSGSNIISGRPSELKGRVLRMKGAAGTPKTFFQYFSCIGNAGDTFVAGGWSAGYSRPRTPDSASSPCRYEMEVNAKIGGSYVTVGKVQWSEEWSGWHFAAVPIVMPDAYSDVMIVLTYQNNLNEAQFSNLFLHREEFGKTFAYDSSGNVTSVKDLAALQSHAAYDSFNNMLTYRQPGRPSTAQYTQTWGDSDAEKKKHLLRTVKSPLNIFQEYGYDGKGNPTSAKTRNSNSSLVIGSTTTYNDTTYPNYAASQTDARGKTVTTVTDANKGTVISVTDPNNQTVSYSYDERKRNTGVSATVNGSTCRNEYAYTGDMLTAVRHNTDASPANDVSYNFAFDSQNRPTTVKAGTQKLSTNTYNTTAGSLKYGTLKKVTYGNNSSSAPQSVAYTYDDYRRVIKVTVDGSSAKTYQLSYGANGQVARLVDNILNRITYSEYDVENRPMRITTTGDTEGHIYTGQVWYDEYNNLKTFREWVGAGKVQFRTDFVYDTENKPTRLTYGDDYNKVEYTYDGIGRGSSRSVRFGTGGSSHTYATVYSYLAGSHNGSTTTGLVSDIAQTGENFAYTYDDRGNISSVTRNGKTTWYFYDDLGQLIRVNDQNDTTSGTTGTTWTYEYDLGGNILNKKRYDYTTGAVGTVRETVTYIYGDSNWKDKLTQYSVQEGTNLAATYTVHSDDIGNPTDDGTWSYTWEKGRQLRQMVNSGSGTTAAFRYNSEGLRVQKTVNGTVTDYTLHGKNIVHLTQGSNTLHFWYDAGNRPAIVEYNGTRYAYIHNLQGDVVGILDSTGTEVVKYTYDAWGKVLSVTGSLASTLGTLQPFRYRGYVYDVETGLYYLRSRYYRPTWERFLNADTISIERNRLLLFSFNCFAYCRNSPILQCDYDGEVAAQIVGGAVGAISGSALGIILADELGLTGWERWLFICAISLAGAAIGVIIGPYVAKLSCTLESAIISASVAANKAIENVNSFLVSEKHLCNTGGRYAKFIDSSMETIRQWIIEALSSPEGLIYPNKNDSYYIITDMGKEIGTKGEHFLKVVYDNIGKIWTAYPVNGPK